jgi:hypothetical protein
VVWLVNTRIFLLSPASCSGRRAQQLLSDRASFPLSERLRRDGATLGEAFTFLSGLYFRGKLTYARAFARPPAATAAAWRRASARRTPAGIYVITAGAGLQAPDTPVTRETLERFAGVDVSTGNAAYRWPLEQSARAVRRALDSEAELVLLGSIATPKYVDVLEGIFGEQLLFPPAFVGRGDMSRGGLLLRAAASGEELDYAPVTGAARHGVRPPRLVPLGSVAYPRGTARSKATGSASKS